MRPALKTIETIERYLLGEMNTDERDAFEFTMNNNEDFRNEVELQKQLTHSLERISLQQTIQNAQKTYTFLKVAKLIGMIVIPIVLMLSVWYFLNASAESTTEAETLPTKVEQVLQQEIISVPDTIIKKKGLKITQTHASIFAENIPSEIFTIANQKETILETENGIVLLIPSDAFVDKDENIVVGNVQIEIKEALDSYTIITAGLSTLFDDKPLETGGMFFIEATKDGKKLQIHPQKEITADIPTQNYKDDMQLFDGEVKADGSVNWTNPKPLDIALIPEDIFSLDFYPPDYLETLTKKGYDVTDKKFTDSLYYSFGHNSNQKKKNVEETIGQQLDKKRIRFQDTIKTDYIIVPSKDSVKVDDLLTTTEAVLVGLNPLKVKAIWNDRYQNTFIATKAFEERLHMIHQYCESANSIFDVYAKNLDRDLHEVDQMIVTRYKHTSLREQFERFASQQLTNVASLDSDVSKLNDYYVKQQKVYRLALIEAQHKMDSLMRVDENYQTFSKQQIQDYYSNELAITTRKISKSLGVRLPRSFNQTRNNRTNSVSTNVTSVATIIKKEKRKRRYRAPIQRTGWKNIDRIINEEVISSLKNRTNTTIQNRKRSVTISYSDYEVSIENTERFDKLFVYLIPKKFNSFVKLEAKNGRFTYKVNDLLRYRVYCIAYLNDVPFYSSKTVRNDSEKVTLLETTTKILRKKLPVLNSQNSSLETEISYQMSKQKNETKVKRYHEIVKLKREIKSVVFPCQKVKTIKASVSNALEAEIRAVNIADVTEDIEEIPFAFVEIAPIFPGCETLDTEAARKKCMSEKIQKFINRNFDTSVASKVQQLKGTQRINAIFNIDTLGIVKDIQVRSNHPKLDAEAKRVIQSLPRMKPATQRGKSVNVRYTIPIVFKVSE